MMKTIRCAILFWVLIIQACSPPAEPTQTVEQPGQVSPYPTIELPSPVPPTPTVETPGETPVPVFEPPVGFKPVRDDVVGVSLYVPGSWEVTGVVPGEYAILQSYPEGKYVGGEGFLPGDTKCDLTIRPPGTDMGDFIQQVKTGEMTTVLSEEDVILASGEPGTRLELDSMGRSTSMITQVNGRVVLLICFGELTPFDQIAFSLGAIE